MTALQRAFVVAVLLGGLTTLAALVRRGRWRECWSYAVYLLVLTSWGLCLAVWPQRFYRWDWWMAKQSVFDVLKVCIALELAYRAVRVFRGARLRLQPAMLAVLGVSVMVIASGAPYRTYDLWQWQPQIVAATIWLFAVTEIYVLFYRLPLTDWHRAVVLAFTARLFLTMVLDNVLGYFGWTARQWFNTVDGTIDVVVSWSLAAAAWRPVQLDALRTALRQRIAAATAAAAAKV